MMNEASESYGSSLQSHRVPLGVFREDVVASESQPGVSYLLELRGDGVWRCNCPGYTYRGECKHAKRKQEESPWS